MVFKNCNKKELRNNLNYFRRLPLAAFGHIQPRWACGIHVDKLLVGELDPRNGSYIFYHVDITEFIAKADFLDANPEKFLSGDDRSDFRILTTLLQWEQGGYIDPPDIGPSRRNRNKITFADGQHRAIAAYYLNSSHLPVAIHKTLIQETRSYLTLFDRICH